MVGMSGQRGGPFVVLLAVLWKTSCFCETFCRGCDFSFLSHKYVLLNPTLALVDVCRRSSLLLVTRE